MGRDYGFPEDSDSEEEPQARPQFIVIKKPKAPEAASTKSKKTEAQESEKADEEESVSEVDSLELSARRRNVVTQTFAKCDITGIYFQITLNYLEVGDKYLFTLKDLTTKTLITSKQEIPREFAIYGVPVDELDDPIDVLRNLKKRLEILIKKEASMEIEQH